MQIRVGYELVYDPQPTPMILTLLIHFTRVSDIIVPDHLIINPSIPITAYRDAFGHWCSRIVAPKVDVAISNTFGPNTLTSFKVWTAEVSVGFP